MKFLEQVFFRRPRILNVLHILRMVDATSQTNEIELAALARYAKGKRTAVEIGTHQGVSASRIARELGPDGILFCVDPWFRTAKHEDPSYKICRRHLRRSGIESRIRILRGCTEEVAHQLPHEIDFAFIDGDHSWSGIETDWHLIYPRLVSGGIVCLHDTAVPSPEPWRVFDSVRFYSDRIAPDPAFQAVETVYSMQVIRKKNLE